MPLRPRPAHVGLAPPQPRPRRALTPKAKSTTCPAPAPPPAQAHRSRSQVLSMPCVCRGPPPGQADSPQSWVVLPAAWDAPKHPDRAARLPHTRPVLQCSRPLLPDPTAQVPKPALRTDLLPVTGRPVAGSSFAQQTRLHGHLSASGRAPARGRHGATAGLRGWARQLRTRGQGQHVGERPRAVEHQVELCSRHPAKHGGRRGPKLPPHFFLESPESENHSEAEHRSDCTRGRRRTAEVLTATRGTTSEPATGRGLQVSATDAVVSALNRHAERPRTARTAVGRPREGARPR